MIESLRHPVIAVLIVSLLGTIGRYKVMRLGRTQALAGSPAFGPEKIAWAKEVLERAGMKVQVGG
jgi:hypothetical protein